MTEWAKYKCNKDESVFTTLILITDTVFVKEGLLLWYIGMHNIEIQYDTLRKIN